MILILHEALLRVINPFLSIALIPHNKITSPQPWSIHTSSGIWHYSTFSRCIIFHIEHYLVCIRFPIYSAGPCVRERGLHPCPLFTMVRSTRQNPNNF